MLVKVFDQGKWSRVWLYEDGTWAGNYCRNAIDLDLPEAHKLCNGGSVVRYGEQFWVAARGPNVYD